LKAGKHGISDQDGQTEYLKAKLGILAPLACLFVGLTGCGWGVWRARRGSNWRQLGWDFASLLVGSVVASVPGVIYMIIVF
jgi:hypothetical protein